MRKNDAHFHIGTGKLTYKSPKTNSFKTVLKDFVQVRGPNNKLTLLGSRLVKGTKKAVVFAAPEPGNIFEYLSGTALKRRYDRFNRRALKLASKNVIPMAFFDSRAYSVADLRDLLSRFHAVKLYPSRDVKLKQDSKLRQQVLGEIARAKATVMIHVIPDNKYDVSFVADLLADLKKSNAKVVFAHFGAFDKRILDFVKHSSNAFIETSGFASPKVNWFMGVNANHTFMGPKEDIAKRTKEAVAYVGVDKIIYGSDHPFLRDIRKKEIALLENATNRHDLIFRENFEKAFGK